MEFLNVDAANTAVIDRIKASAPVLTDVRYAKDVIVEMKEHVLLHAGPPIIYENMT